MGPSSNSPLRQYGEHTKEATLCAQDGLFEVWDGRPDGVKKVDPKDIKITGRRQHVNSHHFTPFGRPHTHFFKPSFFSRRDNSKLVSSSPWHRMLISIPVVVRLLEGFDCLIIWLFDCMFVMRPSRMI